MPRLDRLATLYLCHPFMRLLVGKAKNRVPILMYHSISDNLFGKSHPYYQINASPKVFRRAAEHIGFALLKGLCLCFHALPTG